MRVGAVAGVVVAIVVMLLAAEPAAAVQAQKTTTEVYHVRAGDTLWSLARHHSMTPERLAGLNGISTEATLQIGQRLKVPAPGGVAARPVPASTAVSRAARSAQKTTQKTTGKITTASYHVRAGDTLWSLARRHGTTPERLAGMNGISTEATLRIGRPLKVPGPIDTMVGLAPLAPSRAADSPAVTSALRTRIATLPSRGAAWASTIVTLSSRLLGVRYRWGGTSPSGFDCSGFMYYVFQRTGVAVPRTTYDMFESGTPVPRDQLQAGDFVFFQTLRPGPSHAGIYLGDGRFIHSSSGFGRVTITPMDHRYYAPRYLGARRF